MRTVYNCFFAKLGGLNPGQVRLGIALFCCLIVFSQSSLATSCAWESTKFDLIPTQSFEAVSFINDNASNFGLFPEIDEDQLMGLRSVANNGRLNWGTYEASFNGRDVFIKLVSPHRGAAEALWILFHNRIGLGAQILGVVPGMIPDIDLIMRPPPEMSVGGVTELGYGLVLEKVGGLNLKSYLRPHTIPEGFVLTQRMINEMHRQILITFEAGVLNEDIQFMISNDTIVMIDFDKSRPVGDNGISLEYALNVFENRVRRWKILGKVEQGARFDQSRTQFD
jgi:hypothetical protein